MKGKYKRRRSTFVRGNVPHNKGITMPRCDTTTGGGSSIDDRPTISAQAGGTSTGISHMSQARLPGDVYEQFVVKSDNTLNIVDNDGNPINRRVLRPGPVVLTGPN